MLKCFHSSISTSQRNESLAPFGARCRSIWEYRFHHWPKSCLGNVIHFGVKVSERKNSAGEKSFPNVSGLAQALLSLPFSNASVERIFSQMNDVYSKLRNRLSVRSVEALMWIRWGLSHCFQSSVSFKPTDDMLKNISGKSSGEEEEEDDIIAF